MTTGVLSIALVAAIGAGPGQYTPSGNGRSLSPVGYEHSGGSYGVDGGYSLEGGYGGAGFGGPAGGGSPGELPAYGAYPGNEGLWPYDSQLPWMHGYFQEMPAYGGFVYFRPFNYKHVLSQSQVAGGWGMQPTMPYSQQFWHRFQQEAAMTPALTDSRTRQMPLPRYAGARPVMIDGPEEYVPVGYSGAIEGPQTFVVPESRISNERPAERSYRGE